MFENSYAYILQWLNVQCIDALPEIKLFVQIEWPTVLFWLIRLKNDYN